MWCKRVDTIKGNILLINKDIQNQWYKIKDNHKVIEVLLDNIPNHDFNLLMKNFHNLEEFINKNPRFNHEEK